MKENKKRIRGAARLGDVGRGPRGSGYVSYSLTDTRVSRPILPVTVKAAE